jgi:hypothetical protein
MRPKIAALFVVLAIVAALPLIAQPTTATQFYRQYRAACDKATSLEDLLPWMSKAQKAKAASLSADRKKAMWGMMRSLDLRDIEVVKEGATPNGAMLDVTATGPDGRAITGRVTLVREDGAWKMQQEDWQF